MTKDYAKDVEAECELNPEELETISGGCCTGQHAPKLEPEGTAVHYLNPQPLPPG